jgi:hypothetical protein
LCRKRLCKNENVNKEELDKIKQCMWRTPKSRGEPTWGFTKV